MPSSHTPPNQQKASAKALGLVQDSPSPEPIPWVTRMLHMKEAFVISGRSSSSYYRDVQLGRMPAPVPIGGSSRVPGWELLDALNKLIVQRDGSAAARIIWRGSPLPQPPDLPPIESSFVEHCLERKLGCTIRASEIYKAYCTWCDANGFEPLSVRGLGGALTRLGFTPRKSNQNLYMNVRLRRAGQGVA